MAILRTANSRGNQTITAQHKMPQKPLNKNAPMI